MQNSILDLVGNTPIIKINNDIFDTQNANIFAKLDYMNPSGSMKDRIVQKMILDAENSGKLTKKTTLIEPTSGNTGIALACFCAVKGYKLILVMPSNMSIERRKMAELYGAKIVLTEPKDGFMGAITQAKKLASEMENAIVLDQYNNESNFEAHKKTGEEIWKQMDGKIDFFIAGVGTGGNISGVASVIKKYNPNFKAIAIEPEENDILSGGNRYAPHSLQGIGPNFIPKNFKKELIDEIFHVGKEDAINTARLLAKKCGIPAGITSGATAFTAINIAKRPENAGKNILFTVASCAERYLSSDLFN